MEKKQYKYDVFISYKHAPLDVQVAKEVQSSLEKYRIPREIQKKYGKKKIERVFRDQDELSVGYNLNDEIEEQLIQSEYLIVICSRESRQSIWVKREVETFLKYHHAKNVLPLLIDGEPEEAFPEQLLSMGEPFAADIRAENSKEVLKQLKKEKYRLIAPVLNCSYDELIQRHKRYQMQRIAIFSFLIVMISFAFIASLLRQNVKIQQAYQEELKTESKYLIQRGQEEMAEGDYVAAIRSYLEALPSDQLDRPVLAQAQYGLTELLGLYRTEQIISETGSLNLESKGYFQSSYKEDNRQEDVESFGGLFLSESKDHLVGIDQYKIYVWDTESMKIKHVFSSSSRLQYNIPKDNLYEDCLYFSDVYSVYCYDYKKDEILWRLNDPKRITATVYDKNKKQVWVLDSKTIALIDARSGELIDRKMLKLEENGSIDSDEYCLSEDGEYFIFLKRDDERTMIYTIDHDLNASVSVDISEKAYYPYVHDHLLFYEVIRDGQPTIHAFDIARKQVIWKESFTESTSVKCNYHFYKDGQEDKILFNQGNKLYMMDQKDGKILKSYSIDSHIIEFLETDSYITFFSQSGKMYSISLENGNISSENVFPNGLNLYCADYNKLDFYVCFQETKLAKYGTKTFNKDFHEMDERESNYLSKTCFNIYDHGFFWLNMEEKALYFTNEEEKIDCILFKDEWTDEGYLLDNEISLVDKDGDQIKLFIDGNDMKKVILIDLAQKEVESQRMDEDYTSTYMQDHYKNDQMINVRFYSSKAKCKVKNLVTQEERSFQFPIAYRDYGEENNPCLLSEDASRCFVYDSKQLYLYYLDLQAEKIIQTIDLSYMTRAELEHIRYQALSKWIVCDQETSCFALPSKDRIDLYDQNGELLHQILLEQELAETDQLNISFSQDGKYLYYICKGQLYQASVKNGKVLHSISVEEIKDSYEVQWDFEKDGLILRSPAGIYFVSVRKDQYGITAYVPNAKAYDPDRERIYVLYNKKYSVDTIGYFDRYDLQEIIEIANERVEGK